MWIKIRYVRSYDCGEGDMFGLLPRRHSYHHQKDVCLSYIPFRSVCDPSSADQQTCTVSFSFTDLLN